MNLKRFALWLFPRGYVSSIRNMATGFLAFGSKNVMISADGNNRHYRGTPVVAGEAGSRVYFLTDNNVAGLGSGSVAGSGNVFKVKDFLHFIGSGPLSYGGALVGSLTASSILSYIRKSGGTYPGIPNPAFQAGHARPSAATIYAQTTPGAGKKPMSGVVTIVIWRLCSLTGQPSLMSLPSNQLALDKNTIIVKFNDLRDANNQDAWGIGGPKLGFPAPFYEIPTELGGIVADKASTNFTEIIDGVARINIGYIATPAGSASVADGSNEVTLPGYIFSANQIGFRISFGAYSSWIKEIVDADTVICSDTNNSGGTISGIATISQGVEGITRAVEISYSTEALVGRDFAPDKAFPPAAAQHGGIINDTLFLETADGIIYVGVPGFNGSFPPSQALFAGDECVHYLRGSEGQFFRFGKFTISVLNYLGGFSPLELAIRWNGIGIKFANNAALGANGALLLWLGRPVRESPQLGAPDTSFAAPVLRDFAGWEKQTALEPVVPALLPPNTEVWFYKKRAMVYNVGSGIWCAPVDMSNKLNGSVVAAYTLNEELRIAVRESDGLGGFNLNVYKFDVVDPVTGVSAVWQTPEHKTDAQTDNVFRENATYRFHSPDEQSPLPDGTELTVTLSLIKNFDDGNPLLIGNQVLTSNDEISHFRGRKYRRIYKNAEYHSLKVEAIIPANLNAEFGVESLETAGTSSNVFTG